MNVSGIKISPFPKRLANQSVNQSLKEIQARENVLFALIPYFFLPKMLIRLFFFAAFSSGFFSTAA